MAAEVMKEIERKLKPKSSAMWNEVRSSRSVEDQKHSIEYSKKKRKASQVKSVK